MSRTGPVYQTQTESPTRPHSQGHTYPPPVYGAHHQQPPAYNYAPNPHYQFQQASPHYQQSSFLPPYPYNGPMRPTLTTHQTMPPRPSVSQSPTMYNQPQSPAIYNGSHSPAIYSASPSVPSQPQRRHSTAFSSTPTTQIPASSASTPTIPSSMQTMPGPIKATLPIVVKRDPDGVTWIRFDYTKERERRSYDIRCDVDKVDLSTLSPEFKKRNVVYPRAFRGERYTRLRYETECNETAWALVKLNPELDGHKGLRQRAVDSWRNSNFDRTKASRRVRRELKKHRRAEQTNGKLATQASPDMANRHMHESGGSGSLPRLQYGTLSSTSAPYTPLSAGTSRQPWGNEVMPIPDGTSYDNSYMSPSADGRNPNLPPTPETMADESKRASSAGSHTAMTPNDEHGHGHGHYKGGPHANHYPSDMGDRRDHDQYHYSGQDISPAHKHSSIDANVKTDVFPRANRTFDSLNHGMDAEYTTTRTQVRIGMGYEDKILAVPATGAVRAEKDRLWNERGHTLVQTCARNGQNYAGRPQAGYS